MTITILPQCMPDECKIKGNSVIAYRTYYIKKKSHFAKWKKRRIPEWFLLPEKIKENLY